MQHVGAYRVDVTNRRRPLATKAIRQAGHGHRNPEPGTRNNRPSVQGMHPATDQGRRVRTSPHKHLVVMMRAACFYLFLVPVTAAWSQNLVPNPSFEDLDSCPNNLSAIGSAPPWQTFRGSADLFNVCDTVGYVDVPLNGFGFQYPFDGYGYAGLISFLPGDSVSREFMGAELLSPLTPGVPIYISFRLAVGGWGLFAPQPDQSCSGVGVFFSTVPFLHINGIDSLPHWAALTVNSAPTDTVDWILVSGMYIPDSAYTQIVIGNPLNQSQLEIILLDSSSVGNAGGYVFIDAVCVSEDPGYCPLVTEIYINDEKPEIVIAPNPCTEAVYISVKGIAPRPTRYMLYDGRGAVVDEGVLTWRGDIAMLNSRGWPTGLLVLVAYDNSGPKAKVSIVHIGQ